MAGCFVVDHLSIDTHQGLFFKARGPAIKGADPEEYRLLGGEVAVVKAEMGGQAVGMDFRSL